MSSQGKAQFDELLQSLIKSLDNIKAAAVVDRDGLIISSKLKDSTNSDDTIGSVTAVFDTFLKRVKTDFGSADEFLNIMTVDKNKFTFAAAGPDAILTVIADPIANDNALKVYASHTAKKIKLCLAGEKIDPAIPPIVSVLANMRSGQLPKGDFSAKVIVLGDPSVGKTSLIRRFVDDAFQENYISTIGVDISKKNMVVSEGCKIGFVLWDIGGQIKSMASYRARFYGGANLAFIQFDLTNMGTFKHVDDWLTDLRKSVDKPVPLVLIGNKADLPNIEVPFEMIKQKAEQLNCPYLLTSAKTGANVYDAFLYCAYKYLSQF